MSTASADAMGLDPLDALLAQNPVGAPPPLVDPFGAAPPPSALDALLGGNPGGVAGVPDISPAVPQDGRAALAGLGVEGPTLAPQTIDQIAAEAPQQAPQGDFGAQLDQHATEDANAALSAGEDLAATTQDEAQARGDASVEARIRQMDAQEAQDAGQRAFEDSRRQFAEASDRFSKFQFHDFFADNTTGNKILMGISIAAGAMGAAVTGGRNPALDVLMHRADQSFATQRAQLNAHLQQAQLAGQDVTRTQGQLHALLNIKQAAANDAIAQRFEEMKLRSKSVQVQAQAEAAAAKFRQAADKLKAETLKEAEKQKFTAEQNALDRTAAQGRADTMARAQNAPVIVMTPQGQPVTGPDGKPLTVNPRAKVLPNQPGGTESVADGLPVYGKGGVEVARIPVSDPKLVVQRQQDATKAGGVIETHANLQDTLKRLERNYNEHGAILNPLSAAAQQRKGDIADAQMSSKILFDLGAIQGADMGFLNGMLSSPVELYSGAGGAKLRNFGKTVEQRSVRALEKLGVATAHQALGLSAPTKPAGLPPAAEVAPSPGAGYVRGTYKGKPGWGNPTSGQFQED